MLSLLLLIPIWDSHGGVGKEGHDPTVLPPRPRRGRMAGQRGVREPGWESRFDFPRSFNAPLSTGQEPPGFYVSGSDRSETGQHPPVAAGSQRRRKAPTESGGGQGG